MKKNGLLTVILIIGLLLTGCGNAEKEKENEAAEDALQVFTTVYPLQYFTERIGGEFVNVQTIYPPGADEHTFEPSQKDMIKLADADLFTYVGLGLEGFVSKAEGILEKEDVVMLAAGENIHFEDTQGVENTHEEHSEEEHSHEDESGHEHDDHDHDGHDHGDIDPHVWLDPIYSKDLAAAIKDQLAELAPDHKNVFEQNLADLEKELDELNSGFKKVTQSAAHKEIIVAHSAYGYWEERYGIEQISISGLSTANEPSQKELQELIDHAKSSGLKYVLFEQNFNSKLGEAVQKELDAKALTLHNLSVLTEADIEQDENYFSLMETNLETLDTALNK
ncbi:metal ABC transporter solute-binding protein, Zn/Mn family [Mesobacillus foraminis]|uniref:Zinc transport system substrate-binding protein n=1 Tax=Mesobacillus foraminis TaxID=279826 RepID=A0A4V2RDF0_9BACI|nr:zinc ABC transporter substrate-binding protein [Mesobacillus foraminis]TCN24340.1 zinc transport system substrate-binding protein [Mesobacillus foraminis]